LFKNKFKQAKVSLGQLTILFPTLTILAEGTISISLGDPNLNNLKTFRNYLGLHTLSPTPFPRAQAPAPPQSNPSFEDKVLQALKGLETSTHLFHSHTQSIAKLKTQMGQLVEATTKREYGNYQAKL